MTIDLEEIGRRAVAKRLAVRALDAVGPCEEEEFDTLKTGVAGRPACYTPWSEVEESDYCGPCSAKIPLYEAKQVASRRLSSAITCFLKRGAA